MASVHVHAPAQRPSSLRRGWGYPAAAALPPRGAARAVPAPAAPCAGTAPARRPAFPSGEAPRPPADAQPRDPAAPGWAARPAPPRAAGDDPGRRSADRTRPHASGRPSARGGTAGQLAPVQPATRQHLIVQCIDGAGPALAHPMEDHVSVIRDGQGAVDPDPVDGDPGIDWLSDGVVGVTAVADNELRRTRRAELVAGEVMDVAGEHHVEPGRHE